MRRIDEWFDSKEATVNDIGYSFPSTYCLEFCNFALGNEGNSQLDLFSPFSSGWRFAACSAGGLLEL